MRKSWMVLVICCILPIITGCTEYDQMTVQSEVIQVHADSPAMLIANGNRFTEVRESAGSEFTIGEKVGEVQEKVASDVVPSSDYSSNALEVGTEIYSILEDPDIFLAKVSGSNYMIYISE